MIQRVVRISKALVNVRLPAALNQICPSPTGLPTCTVPVPNALALPAEIRQSLPEIIVPPLYGFVPLSCKKLVPLLVKPPVPVTTALITAALPLPMPVTSMVGFAPAKVSVELEGVPAAIIQLAAVAVFVSLNKSVLMV